MDGNTRCNSVRGAENSGAGDDLDGLDGSEAGTCKVNRQNSWRINLLKAEDVWETSTSRLH